MLIVLGGLPGSGRRLLAQRITSTYGGFYYDIEQKKLRQPSLGPGGHFRKRLPHNDSEHIDVYKRMLRDFPLLSKMHDLIALDDTFHREIPRKFFLAEARKYFSPVLFIWVDNDEQWANVRIERLFSLGIVMSIGMTKRIRERTRRETQLEEDVERFTSASCDEVEVKALWSKIVELKDRS